MLVEHAFVTTLEAGPALEEATMLFKSLGFEMEEQSDRLLVARKGVKNAARAKSAAELPQRIRLEFDRGRIQLAATIEEHRKVGDLHRDLLLAMVNLLESRLAKRTPLAEAMAPWQALVEKSARAAARRRLISRIIIWGLILVLLASFAAIRWKLIK